MLPPSTPTTPPGWYDDPWNAAPLRWFDGTTWTGHVSGPTQLPPLDVQKAIAGERTAGRWFRRILLVYPLIWLVSASVTRLALRDMFEQFGDALDQTSAGGTPQFTFNGGPGTQLASIPALVLIGLTIWWAVTASTAARAVGLNTRRTPGLAGAAFIIPIVSLWWPTQTVRDLFPSSAQNDLPIGRWWAAYLVNSFVAAGCMIASLFMTGPSVLVILTAAALLVALSSYLTSDFVDRSLTTHEQLAAR